MKSNIVYRVSTVSDGNMSVKWGSREAVEENRRRFLKTLGVEVGNCVLMSLIHGTDVEVVTKEHRGKMVEADGLLTREKGLGLMMVTADCLPVVLYEPDKEVIGLVHLGWRGVDGKLVEKAVLKMKSMGCDENLVKVWIGPGVRKGSYKKWGKGWEEFKGEMNKENEKDWEEFIEETNDKKMTLDLVGFVKKQLSKAGVVDENIEVSPVDTVVDKNYFSHHRSFLTGEPEGRFMTVVKISG